ncbi:MAG TPA: hypothetical protein VFF30_04760 [Nitrososphaerales archaeon]|nr:hypothetical protein [Nitrososphaerales archaeon]
MRRDSVLALINDAEQVSVGILKDDEIIVRIISLRMELRSQAQEALYFSLLVIRVEIKV